ncbi:uncharacterized protein LOC105702499 isoform X2 [Orussus abietinus]|uniref:uncharacterized protein LOC105702499 isoform X2 n=1 Tax=Orussus abietinus TaxID=222816 RepID=UPI0006257178|nr:uncharacterized protein LOC105702499 isoform X2 [Orussus abietinus]
MGRRCVVPNCGAKSEKSPGNPRSATSSFFEEHFIKDCFMAKQFGRATLLKKRAVPQLNIFRPEVEKYNPMHVPPSFLKEESHNTTEEVSQ